jgi:hypothetical protein
MAQEGYIQGTSGEEISLLVDGIKIMALQNLSWKASQAKSVIRGAGYTKPHAMGRGPKEYELDFEVKELNKAVIEEAVNSPRSSETQIKTFMVGEQEFSDLLDLRNATVLIMYPAKNNAQRIIRFLGFEFTDVEGGFSVDDESVGRKLSGIAMDAEGLV